MDFAPRVIRLRDAARYLGMDPNRFNAEVRPHLVEIPIGKQGIGFDRLDLDAWFEHYKDCNGRPGKGKEDMKPWRTRKSQGSLSVVGSGISTTESEDDAFAKAVERAKSKKPNDT